MYRLSRRRRVGLAVICFLWMELWLLPGCGGKIESTFLDRMEADAALARNPDDASALWTRGLSKVKEGDLDGALSDFDQAIKILPDLVKTKKRDLGKVYLLRAHKRRDSGDLDGSIQDFEQVVRRVPPHPLLLWQYGGVKMSKGDIEGAVAVFDSALKAHQSRWDSFWDRIPMFSEVSDAVLIHRDRGIAKYAMQDWQGAISDLEKAHLMEKGFGADEDIWALAHLRFGNRNKANEIFSKCIAQNMKPDVRSDGEWYMATERYLIGEIDEKELLRRIETADNERLKSNLCCKAHFNIATLYLVQGDQVQAKRHFEEAVRVGVPDRNEEELIIARAELARLK